jgi:hypothetical protein
MVAGRHFVASPPLMRAHMSTLQGFTRYWSGLRFTWAPMWKGVNQHAIESDAAKVVLPLKIWTKGEEGSAPATAEVQFIAVRCRSSWFLTNGFLWPSHSGSAFIKVRPEGSESRVAQPRDLLY